MTESDSCKKKPVKKKRVKKRPVEKQPVEKQTYTIPEFCDAYSISRSKFYELLKAGFGPRIMKVGRRTLISVEAAEEWQARVEASSNPDDLGRTEDGSLPDILAKKWGAR